MVFVNKTCKKVFALELSVLMLVGFVPFVELTTTRRSVTFYGGDGGGMSKRRGTQPRTIRSLRRTGAPLLQIITLCYEFHHLAWLFVILDVFSIMLCDAAEKPCQG